MSIRYLSGINVDNNVLFVDDANNRVGIGTGTPAAKLDVVGEIFASSNVQISATGAAGKYYIRRPSDGSSSAFFGYNSADNTDFGVYNGSGSGNVKFWSNNGIFQFNNIASSELMRITAAGNVGIGTTSPTFKLDVSGEGRFTSAITGQQGLSISGYGALSNSANKFVLDFYNGNSRLYSMGANASTKGGFEFHTNSSDGSLDVIALGISSTGAATFSSSVTATSLIKVGGTSSQYLMADGSVSTLTNPVTGTGTTNYIPKFTSGSSIGNSNIYDNAGNIGIGVTNADYPLTVDAINVGAVGAQLGIAIFGVINTAIPASSIKAIIGATNSGFGYAAGSLLIQPRTGVNAVFALATEGTEKLRVTHDGNVGIGTTSPSEKLHVAGIGRFDGVNVNVRAIDGTIITKIQSQTVGGTQGAVGTESNNDLAVVTNNTTRMLVTAAGNVGIGTTAPNAKLNVNTDAMGVTVSDASGISLTNTTAAASGAQQMSPTLKWSGQGWKTTATAASQNVSFISFLTPVQGSTAPSGILNFASSINGGAYSTRMSLTSAGALSISAGLTATTGVFSSTVTNTIANLTTTPTDGVVIVTPTAATSVIPVRISPRLRISGTAWNTGGTPATNTMNWTIDNLPTSGNPPTSALRFNFDINGGGYSTLVNFISNGNVGIGSTGPASLVHIDRSSSSNNITGTPSIIISNRNSTSGTFIGGGIFNNAYRDISDSSITAGFWFENQNSTDAGALAKQSAIIFGAQSYATGYNTPSERMRITAAGNVGINTSSPGVALDVNGTINGGFLTISRAETTAIFTDTRTNIHTTSSSFRIQNTGDTSVTTLFHRLVDLDYAGDADTVTGTYIRFLTGGTERAGLGLTSDKFTITTGAAERLTIDSTGNVGIGNTAPTQALHVTGNARVTGSFIDSNNEAGSSGQVLSSTGTGTDWITPVTTTATSLYDLLPAARVAYNWVGQVVNDSWTTVFSKSSNLLTTGTWMVKMYVSDFATGGGHYTYTYSGMFTWYQDTTNQGGESAASEIYLHRMGHAANASVLYLRTTETTAASSGDGLFQIKGNYSNTANQTIQFQFVKIF